MSVATEFAPIVPESIPASPERHLRAVPAARPGRPAGLLTEPSRTGGPSVRVLHAPSDAGSVPLRLTRRGVVVLALLVALVGAALLWVAAASAPTAAAPSRHQAVVTVEQGDTLWSIASRVAPDRDPRAEVDDLRSLNHLDGVALIPGQSLRVR